MNYVTFNFQHFRSFLAERLEPAGSDSNISATKMENGFIFGDYVITETINFNSRMKSKLEKVRFVQDPIKK